MHWTWSVTWWLETYVSSSNCVVIVSYQSLTSPSQRTLLHFVIQVHVDKEVWEHCCSCEWAPQIHSGTDTKLNHQSNIEFASWNWKFINEPLLLTLTCAQNWSGSTILPHFSRRIDGYVLWQESLTRSHYLRFILFLQRAAHEHWLTKAGKKSDQYQHWCCRLHRIVVSIPILIAHYSGKIFLLFCIWRLSIF